MYDTIIIGSGPAGITSAIYAKRSGLNVLIIYKGLGTLKNAKKIENYYGFQEISGDKLHEIGINQATRLGINLIQDEVTQIQKENIFEVTTANSKYTSKTVILATGTNREKTDIKGIEQFEGKGISYCAICDAFFYKNKNVAVLGNGNYAFSEATELLPVAKSVCMLTNGKKAVENRSINIPIYEKTIKEVRGKERLEEVRFNDNSIMKLNGIFIALGIASSIDLAKKIGAITEKNTIKVNNKMETNVEGLFACGDCTGGILQISKAIYEGTIAGLSTADFIKKSNLKRKDKVNGNFKNN